MLKNTAAFWTETALYRYATPHHYTLADFPRDKAALRSESLYPSPWKGGWWRLRDAVDYMLTASFSVLDFAAKYKYDVLYNHHQSSPFPTRIWIPPFAEPVSTYVHPLMWRTVNMLGVAMGQGAGQAGCWSRSGIRICASSPTARPSSRTTPRVGPCPIRWTCA